MTFNSQSSYTIQGKRCFAIKNPLTCNTFDHLKGHSAIVDGVEYVIEDVEHSLHLPPFWQDEVIGIRVTEPTKTPNVSN
jgi:hypothetical protein